MSAAVEKAFIPPPPPPSSPPPPPPSADDTANNAAQPPPPPPPSDDVPPPPEEAAIATPESTTSDLNKLKRKKGWNSKVNKQPLSIEDILKKKKEADEAASKPTFLSKAQREKLALEKRQKEVNERKRITQAKEPTVLENGRSGSNTRAPVRDRGDKRLRDDVKPVIPVGPRALRTGEIPTGPAAMRNAGNSTQNGPLPNGAQNSTEGQQNKSKNEKKLSPQEAEAALIRQRYMGSDQNTSSFSAKKKRRRTTEKKFNFSWNAEEDTSNDYNPLYQARVQANFYGRGRLGGFSEDVIDAVSRKYAKALEDRDGEAGHVRAKEVLEMMELEKRRREETGRGALEKHWSDKRLEQMRERDWRIFKEDFNIATRGGSLPNPMRSWNESGLPRRLLDIVHQVGYVEPTPVQRACIPIALQSRDIIGVAVTGSGKTAAFLIPLLVYISELPPLSEATKMDGPYSIILAPTRELAQQIEIEAKKFATPLGFTCVSIVGGHSIEEQAYNMREGAEIIIATPGRLVDCIERRVLILSQCCYIIMDEADRMIDLGFEDQVNKILDALPVGNVKPDSEEAEDPNAMSQYLGAKDRYRQTMMYTATMPSAVERIARKYLRRPAHVAIGNVGEAVETVEQRVEFISGEDKRKKRLQEILSSREFAPPIIVFVNIKRNCDAVARDIKHMGFSAATLHGSKTQEQREAALASLRNRTTEVLVATDLAGRGIDVQDVSLVLNFNMATNIESYTHRIGRTGRAGKSGIAITFLGNEDTDVMYDLKQMLQKSSISRVPEELRKHEAAQQKPSKGLGQKKLEDSGAFGGKGGWQ